MQLFTGEPGTYVFLPMLPRLGISVKSGREKTTKVAASVWRGVSFSY